MCRVILTDRNDFNLYDRQYGVLALMKYLEKQCGGHGNGYALIKDRHIIETRKGVKLTNTEIYADIVSKDWDYLVWHTRIKSSGIISDKNCHPFVDEDTCLAMNGTEWEIEYIAEAFNTVDSELIFRLINNSTLQQAVAGLVGMNSVFVGCVNGKPYAVKASGDLYRWEGGNRTFHASTFPLAVKQTTSCPRGYIWENGKIDMTYKKPTVKGTYSKASDEDWWIAYDKLHSATKPVSKVIDDFEHDINDIDKGYDPYFDDSLPPDTDSDVYSDDYIEGFTDGEEYASTEAWEKGYETGYKDGKEEKTYHAAEGKLNK